MYVRSLPEDPHEPGRPPRAARRAALRDDRRARQRPHRWVAALVFGASWGSLAVWLPGWGVVLGWIPAALVAIHVGYFCR
ncbi:MAG: hypothetical protein F4X39_04460 [Acidobacteriia bacterium]|nr:hypothetical protein [Terriglobia bacterium]